jgi:hypothetical protein
MTDNYNAGAVPSRPSRPARSVLSASAGGTSRTAPYYWGCSDAANGVGFSPRHGKGRNLDDYTHGYLDTVETMAAIASYKRHNAKAQLRSEENL